MCSTEVKQMLTAQEYEQAEREFMLQEAQRGWRIHASVYALVNAGLIALNLVLVAYTSANFLWFPFPLVGWGIGLAMHYHFGYRHADRLIERRQHAIEAIAHRAHPAV
jgi:2TM domain